MPVEVPTPPNHQLMPYPPRREGVHRVRHFGAALEGTVGKLVVVLGDVDAVLERERDPGQPAPGQLQAHGAGLALAADHECGCRARIEEGMRAVDVVGADGQLEAVEPVADADRARSGGTNAPGQLVDLL